LPRFNCAIHKLGTVVSHALSHQKYLLEILTDLSRFNSESRNCIKTNIIFRELKCRPKIYKKTRWLGVINLLFSNKRAYDNGAYENLECPVDFETIELYIQVLLPAYYITLGWEKSRTSIADIIPAVLYLINAWNKIEVKDFEVKELCYFLIHFIWAQFLPFILLRK
jgi:hypothetical protein